jgi:hypothetical protein
MKLELVSYDDYEKYKRLLEILNKDKESKLKLKVEKPVLRSINDTSNLTNREIL